MAVITGARFSAVTAWVSLRRCRTEPSATPAARRVSPETVVLAGCLIALITFGPRASAGLFQIPMTIEYGWGRDVFGLAIALQNLLWGLGQPFAGAVADRFGALRVLCVGALLYGAGLVVMAYATTPAMLHLGAGVLIGFGLSGCSFNLVLGAFSKLLPEKWRPMAFGAGTAAGSFGQFLFPPIGNVLIDSLGWQQALVIFAATLLLILPLSLALAGRPSADAPMTGSRGRVAEQSIGQALTEAFQHRSYTLLVLGFFTCGFQLAFITAHLPAYLKDIGPLRVGRRLDARGDRARQRARIARRGLALEPDVEALALGLDLSRPLGRDRRLHPPSGIPCDRHRVRHLDRPPVAVHRPADVVPHHADVRHALHGDAFGFAFFSHQVGGFLGVWLGGVLYESYGSYDVVWWLSVALGIASAAINLPIVERPVERPVPLAAE